MDLHNLKSVKLGPKLPVKSLKSSWIHCWWVCSCSKSKISKHLHIQLQSFTIIYIDTDRCPTCSYSTGWEFIFGIPWYAIFWCNNSRWGAGKDEWVPWSLLSSRWGIPQNGHLKAMYKITLLRVIPTLAFQVIYSDIYFDILPNILSDIYSDILSGISSSILSGIYFGVLSGIYSGILCGILSRIYFGILCSIYSGIPSGRWGPAVPTGLGRSLVEVQQCPLRSSRAHSDEQPEQLW